MVELMAVMLIISILAAVATPRLSNSLSSRRLQSATSRLESDIAYARNAAKNLGRSVELQFSVAESAYTLPTLPSPNGDAVYQVTLADTPYPVTLAAVDFGGDASVVFDLFGQADSTGTLTLQEGGATTTLSLQRHTGRLVVQP